VQLTGVGTITVTLSGNEGERIQTGEQGDTIEFTGLWEGWYDITIGNAEDECTDEVVQVYISGASCTGAYYTISGTVIP